MATNLSHNNESAVTNNQNQSNITNASKFQPGLVQTSAPKLKPGILSGCVILIALTLLFALLAFVVSSGATNTLDSSLELALHKLSNPVFTLFFQFFTSIGGFVGVPIMATLVGVLLLWRRYTQYIIPLVLAVGGGILLDELLKQIFGRLRPELWEGIVRLSTFSFPSGHTMASTCFFGFTSWFGFKFIHSPLGRVGWTGLMLVAIVLVGVSRIYLGEHYPSDVIGGFLAGSWWLVVLFLIIRLYQGWSYSHYKNRVQRQADETILS